MEINTGKSVKTYHIKIMPEVVISNNEQNDTVSLNSKDDRDEESSTINTPMKQVYDLPFDLQQEILNQLDLPDYMNLRATSRNYRSQFPRFNWRTPLPKTKTKLSFPLAMFVLNHQKHYNFIGPRLYPNYLMNIPEFLESSTIQYSNNGWLLMSSKYILHLYNPFTRAIESYDSPLEEKKQSLFFAEKPSSSKFSLVSISFYLKDYVTINIRHPGKNRYWVEQQKPNHPRFETFKYNNPVFFQGAYYYLGRNGYLGKFELEGGGGFTWEILHQIRLSRFSCDESFLVECGGELVSVFIGRDRKWVRVYKLNWADNAWEIVSSLGDYSLYLSKCSSVSMVASSPGARDVLYFPMSRGCGIGSYSICTRKWHFSGGLDSSGEFYGSKLVLESCWIQPSWN